MLDIMKMISIDYKAIFGQIVMSLHIIISIVYNSHLGICPTGALLFASMSP